MATKTPMHPAISCGSGTIMVRPATVADAAAAAELVSQLGYPCGMAEMGGRLEKLLGHPEHRVALAERERTVLGLSAACWGMALELDRRWGRVTALCVREGYRGQGIGLRLLLFAESWLAGQGVPVCVIHSSNHRRAAHRFYERHGYRATGIRLVKTIMP